MASDEYQVERDKLVEVVDSTLLSAKYKSIFYEINNTLCEALLSRIPVVLADMPELLLRMKLGSQFSLQELKEIFNVVMNKIRKEQGPLDPGAAALFHFPEVFLKPKDEYLNAIIRNIADDDPRENPEAMSVYTGNVHVSPVARIWNTNTLGKPKQRPKDSKGTNFTSFMDIHKMTYDVEENAEVKIEKQALLEALFQT